MTHESSLNRRTHAALAGFASDEPAARTALLDDESSVRAAGLQALARMSRLTDLDVQAGLSDSSPVVRRRAAELAVDSAVDLVPPLADVDPLVVEAACWSLGERAGAVGPQAVAALAEVTTAHADALCREAAVAALGAIGSPDGLAAILAATGDKPAIRRRAVLALAPFEGPEVEVALAKALTDRDWQVRQAAEDLTAT